MLIYTNGSIDKYHAYIQTILKKLTKASLYLNIKKYEFDYTKTKYLKYII
jgi:hypothetical protein